MPTIIFNGNLIPSDKPCIKNNDRGLTLGHGIFETILIKNSATPALDYHWKRLKTGAQLISIEVPFSKQELEGMLQNLVIENVLQNKIASARVTITHGESTRGIFPLKTPKPNFTIAVYEYLHPVIDNYSALIVSIRKNEFAPSSRIKSLSYLDNILAKQEALESGYDEAILLNTAANVADGTIFNIFMVKNGHIITPPITDGALPGVIRSILLKEFKDDFSIGEESISVQEIMNADEIFLTNALVGIQSVNKLNKTHFNSSEITNNIAMMLKERKNYI
jgi:branched-chain amino acid aminotransferase